MMKTVDVLSLTRRDFLHLSGYAGFAALCLAHRRVFGTEVPEFELPGWVDDRIEEAYFRYEKWRGEDCVITFPVVSDIHSGVAEIQTSLNLRDPKMHLLLIQRAARRFGADFMANLGDIGFDRDTSWEFSSVEHAEKNLDAQAALNRDVPFPVLYAMGNHDFGPWKGDFGLKLTARRYGAMFNAQTLSQGHKLVLSPAQDYGYYDVPGKDCRAFFLNSSDDPSRGYQYGYSDEQLRFVAEALCVPDRFTVVVMQHICQVPEIRNWRGSPNNRSNCGEVILPMMRDFITCSKGEKGAVSWDFTANRDSRLAGFLYGHSHFDCQCTRDGINHVITQSYGTIRASDLPDYGRYNPFDRRGNMLVDMVAIKPTTREMRLFRVGVGGEECDRVFAAAPTFS